MTTKKLIGSSWIIEQTLSLIGELNLSKNSYYNSSPYVNRDPQNDEDSWKKEQLLQEKWLNRVSLGFYGISLGSPVPESWFVALDKFLDYVNQVDPEFSILQIKVKFGGIRIYISSIDEVLEAADLLESVLFDEFLIY